MSPNQTASAFRLARYPSPPAPSEEATALRRLTVAALAELPALAERLHVPEHTARGLSLDLRGHAALSGTAAPEEEQGRTQKAAYALESALLDVKRAALADLRAQGDFDDGVLRHVEHVLDIEAHHLATKTALLSGSPTGRV
ncbi:hypothetical protein [Sphaerisporangium album]|uniref:hypothetical protein n=1 Tax=Sphaerisporangium album TaxID=509200 RepID=UPI0011C05BD3|nr:hypothetical protein [Sphaerisporangium album]